MGIVELLTKIGDDNIKFQNLDSCADSMKYDVKKGTKITFGTDEPLNIDGTNRLGLVLWLDRKVVNKVIKG